MANKNEWFLRPGILRHILYFQSDCGYSLMVMNNRYQEVICLPLKRIEELLPAGRFRRVHRSYLVNMDAVSALRYYRTQMLAEINDYRIPVSRRQGKALLSCLNQL